MRDSGRMVRRQYRQDLGDVGFLLIVPNVGRRLIRWRLEHALRTEYYLLSAAQALALAQRARYGVRALGHRPVAALLLERRRSDLRHSCGTLVGMLCQQCTIHGSERT